MAPLIPNLSVVTAGKETTWGTGVTATYKLMDVIDAPVVDPGAKYITIPSIRGSLAKGAYLSARASEIPPAFTWKHIATYQDISYHLEQMFGEVTPSGAGPYVRTASAPLTAVVATPRKQTMYVSNLDSTDGFFYRHLGCIGKSITISAKTGDMVTMDVERLCQSVASTTATPAATGTLTDRTVTPIMGNDMTLFMDSLGGTAGTTAITPAGYEMSLKLESNRVLDQQLGGPSAVTWIEGAEWDGKLDLTLFWNAANKAFVDATFGTATVFQKLVRVKFTTGSTAIFQFDMGGSQLTSVKINEAGNNTVVVKLSLENAYSSSLSNWFTYSNTNSVSTLV